MECLPAEKIPEGDFWTYGLMLDGCRLEAREAGRQVILNSRRAGKDPYHGGSRSLLRPGNYITLVNHAYPGAAGLSPEAVFHMPEQRAGLSESVTEAEHERTRVRLMNELYEVILLRRAKGVTNDRHLAM
jgi:hypothetical protein